MTEPRRKDEPHPFWVGVGVGLLLLFLLWWSAGTVARHHDLEQHIAERYWVSDVDVSVFGNGVRYTTTDGTKRCGGTWDDGILITYWWACYDVLPPAPEVPR